MVAADGQQCPLVGSCQNEWAGKFLSPSAPFFKIIFEIKMAIKTPPFYSLDPRYILNLEQTGRDESGRYRVVYNETEGPGSVVITLGRNEDHPPQVLVTGSGEASVIVEKYSSGRGYRSYKITHPNYPKKTFRIHLWRDPHQRRAQLAGYFGAYKASLWEGDFPRLQANTSVDFVG